MHTTRLFGIFLSKPSAIPMSASRDKTAVCAWLLMTVWLCACVLYRPYCRVVVACFFVEFCFALIYWDTSILLMNNSFSIFIADKIKFLMTKWLIMRQFDFRVLFGTVDRYWAQNILHLNQSEFLLWYATDPSSEQQLNIEEGKATKEMVQAKIGKIWCWQ